MGTGISGRPLLTRPILMRNLLRTSMLLPIMSILLNNKTLCSHHMFPPPRNTKVPPSEVFFLVILPLLFFGCLCSSCCRKGRLYHQRRHISRKGFLLGIIATLVLSLLFFISVLYRWSLGGSCLAATTCL